MNRLDELLRGRQAFFHGLAERALANPIHKELDDLEIDVRLKKRQAHFTQSVPDIFLGEPRTAAERAKRAGQSV